MINNNVANQMLSMIRNGGNPQQLVISMLQQRAQGNPFLENLLQLAQNNDGKGIEQVARNSLQSQGRDFDKEFADFKRQIGIK